MNDFRSCDEIKELLSPYFDNELDEKYRKSVKKHLRECLICRREFENIKQLSHLIKGAYRVPQCQFSKRKVISSVAALIFLIFLGWFSISIMTTDKTSTIQIDKPMYVNSEEVFLSDLNSEPSQEIGSLIYGN